jgi:pimeloyl-ACP methyl ester carboxylesterase
MAEAVVRGVHINYEVVGASGPWIALTPGSRRPYAELRGLSAAIASTGYRVLLHDRRNCGASDVAFDGSGSEHEVWADDLHELARQLDALPLFVGGSSAGARLAVLFALRHPKALRGLLLWRLTGGQHAVDRLAENYYGKFIKIARAGGMLAVCESEHFAECIKARPDNRERLMRTDVDEFMKVMTKWRESFLQSATLPIVGATEAQLRDIVAPVCLIAGNDVVHTPATARKAVGFIPNSELHDDVVEKRSDDNLREDWDPKEWRNAEPRMVEIFSAFLKRTTEAAAAA